MLRELFQASLFWAVGIALFAVAMYPCVSTVTVFVVLATVLLVLCV